jgi:DNA invertase Pin-like site-specific DNA recombinase
LERPALQSLLADIQARMIDVVVVYKVDRLTRSLADFAKLVELFEAHGVSFVSVTQQFNTTTSMGRLTLNVLLSFAQFEREVAGERIRDKFAAARAASRVLALRENAFRRISRRSSPFSSIRSKVPRYFQSNFLFGEKSPSTLFVRGRTRPVSHFQVSESWVVRTTPFDG